MYELGLKLDNKAVQSMQDLMKIYDIKDPYSLIGKAMAVLKKVTDLSINNGELFVRKDGIEKKINIK